MGRGRSGAPESSPPAAKSEIGLAGAPAEERLWLCLVEVVGGWNLWTGGWGTRVRRDLYRSEVEKVDVEERERMKERREKEEVSLIKERERSGTPFSLLK